ncbi:MAG: RNA polymerase sigma factor [Candidatus Limnocylindrales bacterium]
MDLNIDTEAAATDPVRLVPGGGALAGAGTGAAYERHSAEINGFLMRAVRDVDVAADLLADTFTRLLVEERGNRWPDQPRAWLYRVASNLVMSRGRHLQVANRVDRVLHARERDRVAEAADAEVLRRERNRDLDRALAVLSLDARTALLLAAQGFDGATIALTIGRTELATRILMSRARLKLREVLREDDR